MVRSTIKRRLLITILSLSLIFVPTTSAISTEQLYRLARDNIIFYDPDGSASAANCIGGGASLVSGSSNEEKIWNYFVSANIPGLSNNAAAIAGILGNLQQESTSSFNPFARNGSKKYYGIYQTDNADFINMIESRGWGQYWGTSNAPEDIVNQALQLELDFLTRQNTRFSGEAFGYIDNLEQVSVKTPEAYAELFEVAVEGAVTSKATAANTLLDSGVIALGTRYFSRASGGGRYYQEVAIRRENARRIYDKYSLSPTTSSDSLYTQSNNISSISPITIIGDSITVRSESDIKALLPNADIHAQVGKQFYSGSADNPAGITILRDLVSSNNLQNVLIYALGTNGKFTAAQAQEVLDLASNNTTVIFVTNYNRDDPLYYVTNNNVMKDMKNNNPNVQVVNWEAAASQDPAKYMADNVHPTMGEGTALFAKLLAEAVSTAGSYSNLSADACNGDYNYTITSVDGYVFPLAGATKSNYLNRKPGYSDLSPLPCTNFADGVCHHDYAALDMGLRKLAATGTEVTQDDYPDLVGLYEDRYWYSTGVKVLAISDGTIISYHPYSRATRGYQDRCASVQFRSDVDGTTYWLGHMSYDNNIKAGDTFKAGEVIGEVGPPPCAISTQAHLHINVHPQSLNDTSVYVLLNKLYEALPD